MIIDRFGNVPGGIWFGKRFNDVGVGNNAQVAEPAFLLFHDPCFQHLFNGEILEPHII